MRDVTPETTQREEWQRGTVVEMNGHKWVLDCHVPPNGGVWDRLYDQGVFDDEYQIEDVYQAATMLLWLNYDLDAVEIRDMISSVDPQDFVPAIERAIYGRNVPAIGYHEWVRASLWNLGINPASIDRRDIRLTLEMAVARGAIKPEANYVTCHNAKRRKDRRILPNRVATTNGAEAN